MLIKLHYVKFKNILSYGNAETEVQLDQHKHTIITAKNGQGKSTVVEAICYALYGKPYRSIKIGQLVNTINKKALLVTIEFSKGADLYRVVRGQKPTVFEIYKNNELVLEDAASRDYQAYLETEVLGINFKTFKQIIVMGSANYTPFMNLSAAERRNITEEVLDIAVFSSMQDIAKQQVTQHKSKVDQLSHELILLKRQIESQKEMLDSLLSEESIKSAETEIKKAECESQIKTLTERLCEIDNKLQTLSDIPENHKQLVEKQSALKTRIAKIEQQVETLTAELQFYDNDGCPTCGQEITAELRDKKRAEHAEKVRSVDDSKAQLTDVLDAFNEKITALADSLQQYSVLVTERSNVQYALTLERQNLSALSATTQSTTSIVMCKQKLKELAATFVEKTEEKNTVANDLEYYKVSVDILKDNGIKSKVISTFIPVLNQMINEYLQKFDMFVSFELDETFNETIKSRDRDTFTYNSFSEGEKAKIDAAILFSWRRLAMSRNSISTNILIFDETLDRGMDEDSVNIFIDILGSIEDSVNSIVISHRNVVPELFDRHITVEKVRDISVLKAL